MPDQRLLLVLPYTPQELGFVLPNHLLAKTPPDPSAPSITNGGKYVSLEMTLIRQNFFHQFNRDLLCLDLQPGSCFEVRQNNLELQGCCLTAFLTSRYASDSANGYLRQMGK